MDREERKMSLGIKQLKQDPWETIEEKYPVGSKHTAKVRNFTNFGVFVEIEEGVDGLIHISDLSWTKKVKHPSEFTQIGADIEVQVLEIDKENRRLSLGHKQLEENPWDVFETVFTVGSVHEGTIPLQKPFQHMIRFLFVPFKLCRIARSMRRTRTAPTLPSRRNAGRRTAPCRPAAAG